MKKETRFDMLTHIDEKYLNEAYPKKRNPTAIIIPAIACACALALIAPTVISTLQFETAPTEQKVVLKAENPPTAPQKENSSDDVGSGIDRENDPRYKEYYLSKYDSINIVATDTSTQEGSFLNYDLVAYEGTAESKTLSWNEVCEHYGKDLRPSFIPSELLSPAEAGQEQLWSVFDVKPAGSTDNTASRTIDKVQMYYFENYISIGICPDFGFLSETPDEFHQNLNYYVHDDQVPHGHFSPTNRGVYILADSTDYATLEETFLYRVLIQNAENGVSYYGKTPILFYTDSEKQFICGYNSGDAVTAKNDSHLTEEYQALLEKFLSECSKKGMDLRKDGWSYQNRQDWNDILVENGFPAEDDGGVLYHAALVHDGVLYKLSSNLDFETFAAIAASLIHE